jgi:hypothetical protein
MGSHGVSEFFASVTGTCLFNSSLSNRERNGELEITGYGHCARAVVKDGEALRDQEYLISGGTRRPFAVFHMRNLHASAKPKSAFVSHSLPI